MQEQISPDNAPVVDAPDDTLLLVDGSSYLYRAFHAGGDWSVTLPDGRWRDPITDAEHSGIVAVAELFASLPVALLVRDNEGESAR